MKQNSEDYLSLPGPYDPPDDDTTKDLWFLSSQDAGETLGSDGPPCPQPHRSGQPLKCLPDGLAWHAAEAAHAAALAALSFDFGRLEERCAAQPVAARIRLAQIEALSLGWWSGDRMAADRLVLWLDFRVGATQEDAGALLRLSWAVRRLVAPVGLGVASHLGRFAARNPALIDEITTTLRPLAPLHPVVRGAAAYHLWSQLDERPDHVRGLEAAVLGARLAGEGRELGFLPISAAGFMALTAGGGPVEQLGRWIAGAHHATLAALMALDRLRRWQAMAVAATADLAGRTPSRLIAALMENPLLTAPRAAAACDVSRATAQRNLDLFAARDLIREITGEARFRVWTARC